MFADVCFKSWKEECGKMRASSLVDCLLGKWLSLIGKKKNALSRRKILVFLLPISVTKAGFLLKEKKSYSSAGSNFFFFSSINPDSPVKHKFSFSLREKELGF